MDSTSLIGMSLVCVMGAMSPGPSLAVVLRNTISGGRTQGVMTGIGHGIGFGRFSIYYSGLVQWFSYGLLTTCLPIVHQDQLRNMKAVDAGVSLKVL